MIHVFSGPPWRHGRSSLLREGSRFAMGKDMAEPQPKHTNTGHGIEYMLAGATDWSAADPHAASGTPIKVLGLLNRPATEDPLNLHALD